MQLRLSPSGPVVGDIGTGFVLRRQSASLTPQGNLPLDLTDTPLGSDYLDFLVSRDDTKQYQLDCSAMFDGHEANTNNMQIAIQYSNDSGANWADVDRATQEVPGSANAHAGLFRVNLETEPFAGADVLPVGVQIAAVRFRIVASWGGFGTTALNWSSGVAAVGQLGTTQLAAVEALV